ncbi:hypothetical protein L9F63_000801, partial [Diploptera punctata]
LNRLDNPGEKLTMNRGFPFMAVNTKQLVEFFGRLYQIPLLRVYRKHDRSLQGTSA